MNGSSRKNWCPLLGEWENHTDAAFKAIQKVDEMHTTITDMVRHTKHLEKMDALVQTNREIAQLTLLMKDSLIAPATGKDHIETKTAHLIFKIFGGVIFALCMVIVFLLTGQRLGWFNLAGH